MKKLLCCLLTMALALGTIGFNVQDASAAKTKLITSYPYNPSLPTLHSGAENTKGSIKAYTKTSGKYTISVKSFSFKKDDPFSKAYMDNEAANEKSAMRLGSHNETNKFIGFTVKGNNKTVKGNVVIPVEIKKGIYTLKGKNAGYEFYYNDSLYGYNWTNIKDFDSVDDLDDLEEIPDEEIGGAADDDFGLELVGEDEASEAVINLLKGYLSTLKNVTFAYNPDLCLKGNKTKGYTAIVEVGGKKVSVKNMKIEPTGLVTNQKKVVVKNGKLISYKGCSAIAYTFKYKGIKFIRYIRTAEIK